MNISAKVRVYIYAILLAVQPIAIAYGVVSHDNSVLLVNLVAAILGGGLSLTNITPDAPKLPAVPPAPQLDPSVVVVPDPAVVAVAPAVEPVAGSGQ